MACNRPEAAAQNSRCVTATQMQKDQAPKIKAPKAKREPRAKVSKNSKAADGETAGRLPKNLEIESFDVQ